MSLKTHFYRIYVIIYLYYPIYKSTNIKILWEPLYSIFCNKSTKLEVKMQKNIITVLQISTTGTSLFTPFSSSVYVFQFASMLWHG